VEAGCVACPSCLSKQYGVRIRMLVAVDWAKVQVFGRDISRL
jgi:hypothetical protein